MSGERGRLLGSLFENDIFWLILDLIRYSERARNISGFEIDLVADPPEEPPEYIRPRYSPDGRTAFECKLGGVKNRDINNLASKITQINANGPQGIRNVIGGVLTSGFRIDKRDLYLLAEQNQIYIWDIRRLCFYTAKYCFLRQSEQFKPAERELSNNISFIQYFAARQERITMTLAVFVDDQFHFMDQNAAEEILMNLNNVFSQLQNQYVRPMEIKLQFHALGGVTVSVNSLAATLRNYTTEDLNFTLGGLYGYYTAPWRPIAYLILET